MLIQHRKCKRVVKIIQMVVFEHRGGRSYDRRKRRYQKDSKNFTSCKF